jgi:hypothetical protein
MVSSSSQVSNICEGIDAWTAKTYNWTNTKEYVTFKYKLYSHTEWIGPTEPHNSPEWTYEGDCQKLNFSSQIIVSSETQSSSLKISSSEILSSNNFVSSSAILISSSEVIDAVNITNYDFKLMAQYKQGLLLLEGLNPNVSTHVKVLNSKGQIKLNENQTKNNWMINIQSYARGTYFIQVQQGSQTLKKQFVIQ